MEPLKNIIDKLIDNLKDSNKNPSIQLSKKLDENISLIKDILGYTNDLIVKEITIGENYKSAIFIIDGLIKSTYINDYILKTIMVDIRSTDNKARINNEIELFKQIKNRIISMVDIHEENRLHSLLESLLKGDTILFIDGVPNAYIIETKGWSDRGITEATSQTVVRGPKDSFNETLRTNTMLIRRRIKDENLRVENFTVGYSTKTDVSILYIKDIVNNKIVEEVKARIKKIEIDRILDSSSIEQLIQDHRYSPFPTILNTERPDTCADALLDGFVVVIVDGSPFALILPGLFVSFFQTSEDNYQKFYFSSFVRLLRYLAFAIALLTPSIYIAITTFHQEMLPTSLLISISRQREGIPFPALVEALLMEITFELLREAGIRMPRAIGSAVSIVGALVLGEAAVQAGIVSSVMVIVVSLTAICSLIAPTYNLGITVRLLRFGFMILSASLGLFGISLGLIVLIYHLCSIRSFGVPYLYPIAPINIEDIKDSFIRFPIWTSFKRPNLISSKNKIKNKKSNIHNEREEKS